MNVFEEALTLRIELNLKDADYGFFWISAGEPFSPSTMDREVHRVRQKNMPSESLIGQPIVVTVMPGIERIVSQPPATRKSEELQEEIGKVNPHVKSPGQSATGGADVILNALVVLR